ncbi:MAG TPA: TIGR04283 family arsenosugar biosynthesis glycosyltransferase, partial [Pirellulaceae bacterium]|nr:TIGR04283 family arsenosugar biosynthesis glycosyltransferase [Pirellulaceae bacterium]
GSVRLSVIIPALNEEASIRRAVESAWLGGAGEVLVADGGSTDETLPIAATLNCHVVSAPRGRASQQNAAARKAAGDVLLFLHADCALASDIGAQIDRALANSNVLHGAFRQRIEAPGLAYRWLEAGNAARVRLFGLPYGDQAIFIRRRTFEELDGFPEEPFLEDLILMERLARRCRPVLLPGPVFVSPRRWLTSGVVRQTLRNWWIVARYRSGASPADLARSYRGDDVEAK